jgi:hypothetical protein
MAEAPEGESHHMSDEIERSESEQQPELFPEYTPDYTDSSVWIEVRTPELIRIERGNDFGREVLSGRILISYRKRTPEDGSAKFVVEKPVSKVRPPEEEKVEWPRWNEPRLAVDPRIAKSDRQRGWSLNRNSGCLRADGSTEP